MRRLPLAMCVIAIGLVAAAGYFYIADREPPPSAPFVVEPTAFAFDSMPAGDHDLIIRITNPAGEPRQIIGLAEG